MSETGEGIVRSRMWEQRRKLVGLWSWVQSWENSAKKGEERERQPCHEAVCGGGGSD